MPAPAVERGEPVAKKTNKKGKLYMNGEKIKQFDDPFKNFDYFDSSLKDNKPI